MGGFDTDPVELFAAEAALNTASEEGRAGLARLVASADDVLGHGWQGTAADAFGAGWREWLGGAQNLLTALDELARAFGLTARQYATAEHANVMTS